MYTYLSNLPVLALVLIITLAGCDHQDKKIEPDKNTPAKTEQGFGKSNEFPVGNKYLLPDGITFIDDTIPAFNRYECNCQREEGCEMGSGGLVKVCLNFKNSTERPITVTLPRGLIFVSISESTQNGLLIKVEKIEVPAGATIGIGLNLYCLNAKRAVPAPWDKFILGPVTENEDVSELLHLTEGRDVRSISSSIIIQEAVWNITDRNGLTEEDRNAILSLPSLPK